ncbi:hypothetical protein GCM10008938_24070 [Deinococcus roseus]|uniref:Anti-sigma K factor RskA C-terminal domain-containing protein n=1 Tax=Deinococcus roseus TaxID=392414 RepID=A0ABQ2CZS1_9DEIO|nr:hypothetical protein GCM10008938_24070 [Deinococcus roseus]
MGILPWVIGGILVLGAGAWMGLPYLTGGNPEQQETRTIETWLAANAKMLPIEKTDNTQFASLLKKDDGQALLVMNQPAKEGSVYQVWSVLGDNIEPLGTIKLRTLQVNTIGLEALLVSLEPEGGSESPTRILGDVQLK